MLPVLVRLLLVVKLLMYKSNDFKKSELLERLKGERLFGYVHLVKSERSETARLADKLN